MTRIQRLVTLLFVIVSYSFILPTLELAHAVDLSIDFSQVTGPAQRRATGFEWIFPMNAVVYPFVTQLKPNIIKDPWGNQQLAKDTFNPHKIQWLIGNGYLYIDGNAKRVYPWQDETRFQNYVTDRVTSLTANNESYEWIIWQEPDQNLLPTANPDVWSGTDQQFFDSWKVAVNAIRKIRPNDPIVGPSPVPFSASYLESFLLYAKANNVLPDVLSWHELTDIGGNVPSLGISSYTPDQIPTHVSTMKQFMAANGISINKFDITEYQGGSNNYQPGPTVAFIADIERASNVEGTKGNWGEANQLEGLVTDPTNPQPRSIWWVYKRYADMTGNLVTTTLASVINGFGSYDTTTQTAMVLAGSQGGTGPRTIQLNNIPSGIITNGRVAVTVEQIPNTEKAALAAPTVVSQSDQIVNSGSLNVPIANFGEWDAYAITLKKPTATVNPIKTAVQSSTTVTVTFDTTNASPSDWIGVYKTGAADTNFISWKWINNATGTAPTTLSTNSTVTLPVPNTSDSYEVRYFTKGGYQLMGTQAVVSGSISKSGDLNGDGKVDIFDYNAMVSDFGKTGTPGFSPADIDKNGKVDIFDYNQLVANFGK